MSECYRCAVVGNPIAHSLSPFIHEQFARQVGIQLTYDKIEVSDNAFDATINEFFEAGGKGLNITLPFKEKAYALSKLQTEDAQKSCVANTLWLDGNKLHADNTDGKGLIADLNQHLSLKDKRVLMIGAGGAAKAVMPALLSAGISQLHIANRTVEKATRLAGLFPRVAASSLGQIESRFDIILNATSSSLSNKPLNLAPHLFQHTFCYDMAYQKEGDTAFVKQAREAGASGAVQGIGMLVEQAALSFDTWFSTRPDTQPVINLLLGSHTAR